MYTSLRLAKDHELQYDAIISQTSTPASVEITALDGDLSFDHWAPSFPLNSGSPVLTES